MKNNDQPQEISQEFSLEEIMREFSEVTQSAPVSSGQPEPVSEDVPGPDETQEAIPETAPEVPAEDAPEIREAPEPQAHVTGDTIRLDDLSDIIAQTSEAIRETTQAAAAAAELSDDDATIVIGDLSAAEQPAPEVSGDTVRVDSPENTEHAPAREVYELPQEELPHPPIVFTPHSRLRELKKKLVAGPEKRYYDLTEIGLGRVHAAIFVSILIVLLCAGATALYALDMVMPDRLRLMIFSQVLAMMVSATLGCYVLLDGIVDLFKGRFSLNTMLFITLIACCADAVFCLQELRVPCCAAFSLEMTMALWNRALRRHTEMSQMDILRKAVRLDSLVKVDDYFESMPGILRGEGQVEDFMDTYQETSGPDRAQSFYCVISLLICTGIAVLAGLRHGASMAIQILATSLLVAVPASFFVATSRPVNILQRRLRMVGTVICGWTGVKKLCGKAAYPLQDQDIFPLGATKLNGVKFFGDREPDETIAYACALVKANKGGLEPVFDQLLKSRSGTVYPVENFRYYTAGGIGGEVNGEPVLMGTQQFLEDMGVEIPEGTMVAQAVYCSIDGYFSAVFAISYNRMKSAAAGLVTMCSYRKLRPVLLSDDFTITESFIRSKFGVRTKRFYFPDREVRKALAQIKPDPEVRALALTTQEGLAAGAYAVNGARSLRTACRIGLFIHMVGGILGMLIMLALAYIGSVELLTPVNVLLYQLVWMAPGLLITEWTRTV